MLDVNKIREDFSVLNRRGSYIPIYFDSACMSLKPDQVVKVMDDYYKEGFACVGRSAHRSGVQATKKVKEVRGIVAKFINAKNENEIIFTRNTTESINLFANSVGLSKGDIVLITDKEHNSNLIPWLFLRDKIGIIVKIIPCNGDGTFSIDNFSEMISGAKIVSVVHTSNLDGVTNPIKEISQIAHKNGALIFVDGAQGMAHKKIDVRDLDIDFLAFSGHKMLGPTGTGVLYGKASLLEKLTPFMVGGNTVSNSTYTNYEFLGVPDKFEAGLQDYAGILGLGEAIKYLNNLDWEEIEEHELKLNTYLTEELKKISKIKIIGPENGAERSSVVNFYIEGVDMNKIAIMLDEMANVEVRSGRHCVHSWFEDKKIYNSLRVSFSIYNTMEEAEIFITNLNKIMKIL